MAAQKAPDLGCRMYEEPYPEVDTVVMFEVTELDADSNVVYVSLPEYNNIEAMISYSELSRVRIRSVISFIRVGCIETGIVLRVDKEKGYVDLSKKRIREEEIEECNDRYGKSKAVHSIMRHVAETVEIDLEELYVNFGWPMYRKYGHAYEAFKIMVANPDTVWNSLTCQVKEVSPSGKPVTKVVPVVVTEEIKRALIKEIRRRMTPHPLKIRADIEMTCYQFDGVLHIKDAMRKALAEGNQDCPLKFCIVAAPRYILTTQTLDMEKGIEIANKAIAACIQAIKQHGGKLVVKEAPRVVSESEDKLHVDGHNIDRKAKSEFSDSDENEKEEKGKKDDDEEEAEEICF